MNTLRKNSEIAFCGASFELVRQCLLNDISKLDYSNDFYCDSKQMNSNYYSVLFRKLGMGFSQEEMQNLYIEMKQQTKALEDIPQSLFQLLVLYGKQALILRNGRPLCRREAILGWRSTSLRMGQDIFTTALLAYEKAKYSLSGNLRFDYSALINTDDARLNSLLCKGIAENHFHLSGSTRHFPLSWIFLMNNPKKISSFFDENNRFFKTNRNHQIILSDNETIIPIRDKLFSAAWIRAKLFMRLNGNDDGQNLLFEFLNQSYLPEEKSNLYNIVMSLRLLYGVSFEQPYGKKVCLDYAIKKDSFEFDINSYNRLLWGEREFLFSCFYKSFKGELSENDQNLFYMYLLIKSQFRAEMIQINQEVGFANFSEYQDRKDIFWGNEDEYLIEAQRLAVCATLESGCIKSLEMRITPKKTSKINYWSVLKEDEYIYYANNQEDQKTNRTLLAHLSENKKIEISKDFPFFYVTHFIKKKQCDEKEMPVFGIIKPRNFETREMAKKCAVALSVALEKSNYLCSRIRGIDAASFEIGCRPEVFATSFRYLRSFSPNRNIANGFFPNTQIRPMLGVTYHVGEDFLDISDGLRAIDEAIRFLKMKRGDRIGHALALGVDPKEHYYKKNMFVALPKQDMLDNMVWLLKRSSEFGIDIHKIRPVLQDKANHLLREIYGECINRNKWNVNLDDYYSSWKLRGDNPKLYMNPYNEKSFDRSNLFRGSGASVEQFKCYYLNDSDLDVYRNQESVRGLLYFYHFGYIERKIGAEIYTMEISDSYIELMSDFQTKMQSYISDIGIAIECNLSSNQLIGTFSNYENHPIFKFNDHIISENKSINNLSVSINTDDQGIFDTSLENEYAILVECMAQMKSNDERRYNDDIIFEYIDHIRKMGLSQVFPKSGMD